ncbi:hypothetical protein, partial [Jannaschia sp. LMIT008]|uniref:hypothetical protein n=1 Tax=Jannaschia maritima TaxID=3032585 RepID=UPI0028114676
MTERSNKVLTVSYGTFTCRLEGYDDPVEAVIRVAAFFRDTVAADRRFGALPGAGVHTDDDVSAALSRFRAEDAARDAEPSGDTPAADAPTGDGAPRPVAVTESRPDAPRPDEAWDDEDADDIERWNAEAARERQMLDAVRDGRPQDALREPVDTIEFADDPAQDADAGDTLVLGRPLDDDEEDEARATRDDDDDDDDADDAILDVLDDDDDDWDDDTSANARTVAVRDADGGEGDDAGDGADPVDDVERLFAATDSRLSGDDNAQARDRHSRMKAVVAARRDDESLDGAHVAEQQSYRDDLRHSIQPRHVGGDTLPGGDGDRPRAAARVVRRVPGGAPEGGAGDATAPRAEPDRAGTLMLVSEQRADGDGPIRPRRVRRATESDDAEREILAAVGASAGDGDDDAFPAYAAELGAKGLHDLIEAAA